MEAKLAAQCAATDAGYPDNADLMIDDAGRPSLKHYRAPRPTDTAVLEVLSPYLTARIQRFGVYATDEVALAPEPFDTRLVFDLAAAS